MCTLTWHAFLSRWQLEKAEIEDRWGLGTFRSSQEQTLGLEQPVQAETEIMQLEQRLGRSLPPSYREFLQALGVMAPGRLSSWTSHEIKWLHEEPVSGWWENNLQQLPAYPVTRSYGQARKLSKEDGEYLRASLRVAPFRGDGGLVYFLNPLVISAEGEWEAWSLSQRDFYVTQYASFWEMMQAQYADFQERAGGCRLEPHFETDSLTNLSRPVYPWKELLTLWSRTLLKPGVREEFHFDEEAIAYDEESAAVVAAQWLGYEPAPQRELQALEARLGRNLPASYRQFLQVTNGFGFHIAMLLKLWPVEKVQWVADSGSFDWEINEYTNNDKETVEIPDDLYFDYSNLPYQKGYQYRLEHLKAALEIGGFDGNDYYLLNPLAVTPQGEWEAWRWLHEGGAERCLSFWTLMQESYYLYCVPDFPFL